MPTIAGLPPPRLHAGGDPRLRRARSASRRTSRRSTSRSSSRACATTSTARSPRVMTVLRPLELVIEIVPRERGRGARRAVLARRAPSRARASPPRCAAAASCRSRARSSSIATTSPRRRPRAGSASRRARRCACATAYIVTCTRVEKDDKGEIVACHLHARSGDARRHRAGRQAHRRHDPLGERRARDRRRGAPLRSPLHRARIPGEDDTRLARRAEPGVALGRAGEGRAEPRRRRRPAIASSSSASASSIVDPDTKPGAPVFNRTVAAEGRVGEGRRRRERGVRRPNAGAKATADAREARSGQRRRPRSQLSPEATALRDAHGLSADEARVLAQEPLLHGALRSPRSRRATGKTLAKAVASVLVERRPRRDAREEARRAAVRRRGDRRARAARPGRHDLDEAGEGRPRRDDRDGQGRRARSSKPRA